MVAADLMGIYEYEYSQSQVHTLTNIFQIGCNFTESKPYLYI
jgi:hypothetical protein